MQALIRLKRPLDDSPSETLILNCHKKIKLDVSANQAEEPLLTVLKFTGTQDSQDEDIAKHVTDLKSNLKTKLSYDFKKHSVELSKKLRLEAQEISKNNRYKVVSCLRSKLDTSNSHDEDLAIYDLELGYECSGKSDQKFVYDLYYTNTNVLNEVDNYNISVFPTTESLVFDSDEVFNIDEENDDSEDSNAENNWRNDYPNESDVESVNESDIIEAVKNIDLNDTLSSEDEFPYCTENNEEYNYELDELDENKYGTMYAKFKSKYKDNSELTEEDSLSDSSENDYST